MYGIYGPYPEAMPDELKAVLQQLTTAERSGSEVHLTAAAVDALRRDWESLSDMDYEGMAALGHDRDPDMALPWDLAAVMGRLWAVAVTRSHRPYVVTLTVLEVRTMLWGLMALMQRVSEGQAALARQQAPQAAAV